MRAAGFSISEFPEFFLGLPSCSRARTEVLRTPRVIRIGEIDPLAGTRVAGPEDLEEKPRAGIAQVFRQQFDVRGAGGMVALVRSRA